jgi:protease-4
MLRLVFLILTSPIWLPFRAFRYATTGQRKVEVLSLRAQGSLPDFPRASSLLSRLTGRGSSGVDLLTLVQALDHVTREPRVKQVTLYIDDLHCGMVRAEEVRAALVRVRDSGKHVVAYAETLSMDAYWLALGASQICLMPTGTLAVTGVSLEFTLLKGFLDKLGLQAQLRARGKYKSMAEMFTQTEVSDANREMLESLSTNLFGHLVTTTAAARELTREQVEAAFARGPLRASEALEAKLVDRLAYADELRTERESLRVATLGQYLKRIRARRVLPRRQPRVALLQVTSNIKSGGHSFGPNGARRATGSTAFARAVRRVAKDPQVKGVVLRVDSPGGSALASDAMWRELTIAVAALKEKKVPFVVSMANIAASGGYYVSGLRGVDVWASPMTLTGSIGVVAGKYEASDLLRQLGIKRVAINAGPRANYYSWSTPWNEADFAKLESDLDAAYGDFVRKMADGRQLSYEQLHAVAQGRVWTGSQALTHGLVDRLGGLFDVCQALTEATHAPISEVAFWNPELKGGFGRVKSGEQDSPLMGSALVDATLGPLFDYLCWANWFAAERLLMVSPIQHVGQTIGQEFTREHQ